MGGERPLGGDLVEDLMQRVREATGPPRHVFRLMRYLVAQRERLGASYGYVSHSPEHTAFVLREVAAAEATRIAEAEGRTGMVRELMAAFLDASERARRENAWGDAYAEEGKDEGEGFAEASALEAGSRWDSAA